MLRTHVNNDIYNIYCLIHNSLKCWKALYMYTRGRTYVTITYVSKENNLGPGEKIRYFWSLKGPILICNAQLVRTSFLCRYQMLSFYEIKSFTRALRNTDHEVSVPKCHGKWLYFINQGQLFQLNNINTG